MLSQPSDFPCPHGSGEPPGVAISAPGTLPIVKLHEQLDAVADSYAWYTRLFPRVFWAKQPDPIAACHELRALAEQLDIMAERIADARRHVELLWDLSCDESIRRRSYG